MLPDTVIRRLEALGVISQQEKRINGLFRLMEEPILWYDLNLVQTSGVRKRAEEEKEEHGPAKAEPEKLGAAEDEKRKARDEEMK